MRESVARLVIRWAVSFAFPIVLKLYEYEQVTISSGHKLSQKRSSCEQRRARITVVAVTAPNFSSPCFGAERHALPRRNPRVCPRLLRVKTERPDCSSPRPWTLQRLADPGRVVVVDVQLNVRIGDPRLERRHVSPESNVIAAVIVARF